MSQHSKCVYCVLIHHIQLFHYFLVLMCDPGHDPKFIHSCLFMQEAGEPAPSDDVREGCDLAVPG